MTDGVNQEKPTFLVRSWKAIVLRKWGAEFSRSDTAYEFSNGKRYESSDRGDSGVYEND